MVGTLPPSLVALRRTGRVAHPTVSVVTRRSRSAHKRAYAFGSHDRWISIGTGLARKIDKSGATNDVFDRHVADRRKHPAVRGIVTVITEYKDVASRNVVDSRVVVKAVVDAIECFMARAIHQCFAPALGPIAITRPARLIADDIGQSLPLHRHAVDVEQPLLHLNAVARQSNDTLDVADRVVSWRPEDNDVAALRHRAEYASRKQTRRKRQGIAAVAISIFRDEQTIAFQ